MFFHHTRSPIELKQTMFWTLRCLSETKLPWFTIFIKFMTRRHLCIFSLVVDLKCWVVWATEKVKLEVALAGREPGVQAPKLLMATVTIVTTVMTVTMVTMMVTVTMVTMTVVGKNPNDKIPNGNLVFHPGDHFHQSHHGLYYIFEMDIARRWFSSHKDMVMKFDFHMVDSFQTLVDVQYFSNFR